MPLFSIFFFHAAATASRFGSDRALAQSLTLFLFLFYTAAPAARFRRDRALRAPSWGVTKNSAL